MCCVGEKGLVVGYDSVSMIVYFLGNNEVGAPIRVVFYGVDCLLDEVIGG